MGDFSQLLRSSVGGKLVMALTGLAMALFTIIHMTGNLLVFKGPDAINAYGVALRDLGPLLWFARLGLIAFVAFHVMVALRLTGRNKAARQQEYAERRWKATAFPSRFMVVGGVALLVFIVFHLAHYTFGWVQPGRFAGNNMDSLGRPDVYGMVVAGFSNPIIALGYVIAMVFLASHLAHGASSLFQTLGLNHPRYDRAMKMVGPALAVILAVGFSSVPLGVLLGFVG